MLMKPGKGISSRDNMRYSSGREFRKHFKLKKKKAPKGNHTFILDKTVWAKNYIDSLKAVSC